jgi:hypothetical protein
MMDLDHFKAIKDTFGHPAGDAVLKRIAQLVQASTRCLVQELEDEGTRLSHRWNRSLEIVQQYYIAGHVAAGEEQFSMIG